MKIVVLAGGLSTERQVALTSGTGVCRALRERGHQAILVDMFLGLEQYHGRLGRLFGPGRRVRRGVVRAHRQRPAAGHAHRVHRPG